MPIEAQDKLLTHAAQLSFYNTSKMDLNRLGETGVHHQSGGFTLFYRKTVFKNIKTPE